MAPAAQFRIVLVSVCASVIVIAAAIWGIAALWQPRALESLLPDRGTVALVRNAGPTEQAALRALFPAVAIPEFSGTTDIAVLEIGNGRLAWVASPVPYHAVPEANVTLGRQKLFASDSVALESMLKAVSNPLASSKNFRALSRGMADADARIYLRDAGVGTIAEALRPLFPGASTSGGLLLSLATGAPHIRVLGNGPAVAASATPLVAVTPAPDFLLETADPEAMLNAVLSMSQEPKRAALLGRLQNRATTALPGEWSWTYDLVPMLRERTTLRVRTGTGGTVSFLLEGGAGDAAGIKRMLAQFHDAFRAALPGKVTTRTLDRNIVSKILEGGSEATEREWKSGNFSARETRDAATGTVFVSAVSGKRYLVGNSAEWMEQAMAGQTPSVPAGPGMMRGTISAKTIQKSFSTGGSPLFSLLQNALGSPSSVAWAVSRETGAMDLELRAR